VLGMTRMQQSRHLADEEFELYSRGKASEDCNERFEEHLLGCEECVRRLEEAERYLIAVTGAAREVRDRRRAWFHLSARVAWKIAAGIALVTGGLMLRSGPAGPLPAVAVMLEATRGAADFAQAPRNAPLELHPDLGGLPVFESYRLELADAAGAVHWEGSIVPSQGKVRITGRSAGTYFVRVYSPARQLLREYSLRIGG
jgi:hypothetical protein